uniref:Uncharacterized protein n=1 Tax=Rhizophora mucronata TaxID=61149 RepID=A0A2P2P998_RHIMU
MMMTMMRKVNARCIWNMYLIVIVVALVN